MPTLDAATQQPSVCRLRASVPLDGSATGIAPFTVSLTADASRTANRPQVRRNLSASWPPTPLKTAT
jgi:hypothetical protein